MASPLRRPTVPNAIPTVHVLSAHLLVIASTFSGTASVVRSRSPARLPRNASRTDPPTSASSCPARANSSPSSAAAGVCDRSSAAAALRWPALSGGDSDTGIAGLAHSFPGGGHSMQSVRTVVRTLIAVFLATAAPVLAAPAVRAHAQEVQQQSFRTNSAGSARLTVSVD